MSQGLGPGLSPGWAGQGPRKEIASFLWVLAGSLGGRPLPEVGRSL